MHCAPAKGRISAAETSVISSLSKVSSGMVHKIHGPIEENMRVQNSANN